MSVSLFLQACKNYTMGPWPGYHSCEVLYSPTVEMNTETLIWYHVPGYQTATWLQWISFIMKWDIVLTEIVIYSGYSLPSLSICKCQHDIIGLHNASFIIVALHTTLRLSKIPAQLSGGSSGKVWFSVSQGHSLNSENSAPGKWLLLRGTSFNFVGLFYVSKFYLF